jgi:hypothetical protein
MGSSAEFRLALGLWAGPRQANHNELLGLVPFESDRQRIDQATEERLALVSLHLESEQAPLACKVLAELTLARQCLLCPQTKQAYDARLRGQRPTHARWSELPKRRRQLSPRRVPPSSPASVQQTASQAGALTTKWLLAGSAVVIAALNVGLFMLVTLRVC